MKRKTAYENMLLKRRKNEKVFKDYEKTIFSFLSYRSLVQVCWDTYVFWKTFSLWRRIKKRWRSKFKGKINMIPTLSTWFRRWIIIDRNLYQCNALKFLIFFFCVFRNACVWCYRTSPRDETRRKKTKQKRFVCLLFGCSKWKNQGKTKLFALEIKMMILKETRNKKQQAEKWNTLPNKPQRDMRIRENVVHRTNGIENLWFQKSEQNFCLLIWRRVSCLCFFSEMSMMS